MIAKLNIQEIILSTAKLAGVISVAILAPNALQALKLLDGGTLKRNRKWYVDTVITRTLQRGLLKIKTNKQGNNFFVVTKKGEEILTRYEMGQLSIVKPKKWDKKYRVIIFDIKEHRRNKRDDLRNWLHGLGFVRLQNSVWVFPYECREVVMLLKFKLGVGSEVLYLTVEAIENDMWLKKTFSLPLT